MDDTAVVSETDAAHSSEDEDHDWLTNSADHSQPSRLQRIDEQHAPDEINDQMGLDDSDEDEINETDAADELYCANMDDEDEAWVYKHLRGGKEEPIYVRMQQSKHDGSPLSAQGDDIMEQEEPNSEGASEVKVHENSTNNSRDSSQNQATGIPSNQSSVLQNEQMQKALLLKPRSSDAILSCPRCFTTVCMDCQQHESYANQYRAMFVMNIGVDWNKRMIYDDALGGLKLLSPASDRLANANANAEINVDAPDRIPQDLGHNSENEKRELYYSVHCGYCQLEVAALDMSDEIYYFFGCIASA